MTKITEYDKRLMILLLVVLVSACSTQGAKRMKFDKRWAAGFVEPGKQTLLGTGVFNDPKGIRYECAGNEVHLIPKTPYASGWMTLRYGHFSGGMASVDTDLKSDREFLEYRHIIRCDKQNRFEFRSLRNGEYYLETRLSGSGHARTEDLSTASLVRIRYRPDQKQFYALPRLAHAEKYLVDRFEQQQKSDPEQVPDIREVQVTLAQFGLDSGVPDGNLHKKTRKAIKQFQIASALPVTGFLDSKTLLVMESAKVARENWTDSVKNTVWVFVATSNRIAHGAAAGRDRLEAFSKALRQCVKSSDSDPGRYLQEPCTMHHVSEVGSSSCVALVMRYFTWEKFIGFGSTRKMAYENAYRACGAHPQHCKSARFIGAKMEHTYCGSDFNE